MLNRFSYIQKNKLLLPVFGIGLLLCWFLAFSKTFDAVKLNNKLSEESNLGSDISFNPTYVQRKLAALDKILKGYKVTEDWNDKLWIQSSAIAAKQNVGVDFVLNKITAESDSTSAGMTQSLYFYSNYVQLVKLVDTLESLNGIGRISALQVKAPKADLADEKSKKCVLRLDFRALDPSSSPPVSQ